MDRTLATPQLSNKDFDNFRDLVAERFGLHFPDNRRSELERGVWQAFAASTCSSPEEFFYLLKNTANGAVHMERLANALTICETHFFRDEAQFDALYQHVFPEIIERRRSLRTIRVWSAGCASGEEPYSIAILLRELLPDIDDWSITILGTDINTQALDRARQASFSDWAFREERARRLRPRYFHQEGNRYLLDPAVRRMVTFSQINLVEDSFPSYTTNTTFMDLILCRNVTIYFSENVTRQVVDRLYLSQVEGGWLVVGHSEPSLNLFRRYQVRNFPNTVLYQRTEQPLRTGLTGILNPNRVNSYRHTQPLPRLRSTEPPVDDDKKSVLDAPQQRKDPLEHARELLNFGRSEQARDFLLDLASRRPHTTTITTLLGRAYANLGCWRDAERWCQEAIRLDRLNLEAYYTLGLVQQHLGQPNQAIETMKKVVYIDRKHALAHFNLANLYHQEGLVSQALKSLDNVQSILEGLPNEMIISNLDGISVLRLRDVVTRLQQYWSVENEM